MARNVFDMQAQVESLLVQMAKAASVELTKLFESRYQAAFGAGGEGRGEGATPDTFCTLSSGGTKRSVGVRVDEDISPLLSLHVSPPSRDAIQGVLEEVSASPGDFLLDMGNNPLTMWSPMVEPSAPDILDLSTFAPLCTGFLPDDEGQTGIVLQEPKQEEPFGGTMQASLKDYNHFVGLPDTSDPTCEEKVQIACPLFLKVESPEKPQKAYTANGSAYSPSETDGAATSSNRDWAQIHPPMQENNHVKQKLDLTSQDPKLLRPCTIPLVDVTRVPQPVTQSKAGKSHLYKKRGSPLPKDLRIHQGPHTGHRICCFEKSEGGVWHLLKGVSHTRDGYACGTCSKTFKRKKILRRHERFHTGEKPYSCSQCPKKFALRKSLRHHIRFHTGEKPHTCPHCSKRFCLRDNLKTHLRLHSGEKPLSCTVCNKAFRKEKNLKQHRLSQCGAFVPSFRTIAGL